MIRGIRSQSPRPVSARARRQGRGTLILSFSGVPRSCVCVLCRHRAGELTPFLSFLSSFSYSRKLRQIIFTSTTVRPEVGLRLNACLGVSSVFKRRGVCIFLLSVATTASHVWARRALATFSSRHWSEHGSGTDSMSQDMWSCRSMFICW